MNRIATAIGCCAWLLTGLFAAQRCEAQRMIPTIEQAKERLDAALASARQSDEPVAEEQIAQRVTPEHRAGQMFLEAALAVDTDDDAWRAFQQYERPSVFPPSQARVTRPTAEERAVLQEVVASQRDALARAKQAAAAEEAGKPFSWNADYTKPLMALDDAGEEAFDSSVFTKVRNLALLLAAASRAAHAEGRDDLAIEHLTQLVTLAHMMEGMPLEIGPLVQTGVGALAADAVAGIAPTLRIGTAPGEASQESVKRLITLLTDDAPFRRAFQFALHTQRLMVLQTLRQGNPLRTGGSMGVNDAADIIPLISATVDAFEAPTRKEMGDRLTRDVPWAADLESHFFYVFNQTSGISILAPSVGSLGDVYYRGVAGRHLAAIVLASRSYESRHGAMPYSLEAMTPTPLTRVSIDPLDPDGQPLRLDPQRALVWSVGLNRRDDAGNEGNADDSTRHLRETTDIVFRLRPLE